MKYLDEQGVQHLWTQLSLEDYPNNETLIAVLNAIDETKADKQELEENYLKKSEGGDVKIEGEIQADNVPHIVEEKILCTIPAATIQEAITNGVKNLTVDAFEHDPNIIVYATYGGKEYTSFVNEENYLEFFIANPYVTDGFACSFQLRVDADGNADETKAKFNYRVLDSENITDLVLTQLVVNTIDSKYFDHDFTVVNSISMNRRGDIGLYSTALGASCVATGQSSFATGLACEATGTFSTAVGKGTFATGEAGLSTGLMTTAGREAFANGRYCEATGRGSLATGNSSKATGQYSTAEGQSTIASGSYSHTEGQSTAASKTASHAEGLGTLASSNYQHVEGKYNIEDTATKYAHIIGNGTGDSARSNAYTLDWNGNLWTKGNIKIGGTNQDDETAATVATEEYVENLFKALSSDRVLRFYCIEDVSINLNGTITTYPANSNVEIKFLEGDVWELIPTSNNSILALNGFPGALGTYYPWLEGIKQFSNILFDMNDVEMYSKWSQGNQGAYQVQYAQYQNCIFWSDNTYVSDVSKRTNYTLYYTSQLPLCYSSIPENTFKAFYLAFNANSDPNWGNKTYRDSFAQATWATQVFSYYGARTIGIFGHDDPDFNITLPKDCRGLMYQSTAIENAGTFDAINVTNFGAKSGSWREAFGQCSSLRNLYIKNLKVNLNISWSPINYESISFIISTAANTNAITISVSPYTYNLLSQSDFDLAASKNITIALLATNYVEDKRLGEIANKADKTYVDERVANLVNSAPETLDTIGEIATALQENDEVVQALNEAIAIKADKTYVDEAIASIPPSEASENALLKTEQELTTQEQIQVRKNLKLIGRDLEGQQFTIEGQTVTASANAEILGDYSSNIATGQWSIAEGSGTLARGRACHAEGAMTQALNDGCHTEGYGTKATGYWSHAEGEMTVVSSYASHAEGSYCTMPDGSKRYSTAAGYASHTEGGGCHTTGSCAHAEGLATLASGNQSHVEGRYTIAAGSAQHVEGVANIEDTNNEYIHIAGNGAFEERSNAYTLDWDGNAWFSGDVYTGSTSGLNKDEGSKKLATEEYVNIRVPAWTDEDEGKVLKIVNGIPTWTLL